MSAPKILVITTTLGYHHDSISTAITTLQSSSTSSNLSFTFTETPSPYFDSPDNLLSFSAICFLSTTGAILSTAQLTNLASFASKKHKAVVGIHSATLTNDTDIEYTNVFGTTFDYHPELQAAAVYKTKAGMEHTSTKAFPERIDIEDEWYNFRSDPTKGRQAVTVVLAVDEATYKDAGERLKIDPHPVCWYRDCGEEDGKERPACRVWYTSLGHTHEIWKNDVFVKHVLDGMKWATEVR